MKSKIIIFLLLARITSNGQIHSLHFPQYSLRLTSSQGSDLPEADSLKVLFLVSDTSRQFFLSYGFKMDEKQDSGSRLLRGHQVIDTIWRSRNTKAFSVEGFIARQRKPQYIEYGYLSLGYAMEPVAILDADKKPLSPNLIIWQTLPRK